MGCPKGGAHAWTTTFQMVRTPGARSRVHHYDVCAKCGYAPHRILDTHADVVRAIQRQGVPKAEAERRARGVSSVEDLEDELVFAHYARDRAIFATRGVETVGGWTGGYGKLARGHAAWSVNMEGSS